MKTPREVLLQKHMAAESRLDTRRKRVLAAFSEPEAPACHVLSVLRNVFALPRPAWALLMTAWVTIAALTFAARDEAPQRATAMTHSATLQALAEQRRLYSELIHSSDPAQASSFAPRPRSHYEVKQAAA